MVSKVANTINVDKFNYLIFSTGKKQKLRLTVNDETLLEKEFTKYLGVVIDNKLTWNQHITQTNLRLSKRINVLYKLRKNDKPLFCISIFGEMQLQLISNLSKQA